MSSWTVTAGVPVLRPFIRLSRAWSQSGASSAAGDLLFWEEVPVLAAAFDQPVGEEQEPVTGRPARGERGEVVLQAKRQGGRPAGQRLQVRRRGAAAAGGARS